LENREFLDPEIPDFVLLQEVAPSRLPVYLDETLCCKRRFLSAAHCTVRDSWRPKFAHPRVMGSAVRARDFSLLIDLGQAYRSSIALRSGNPIERKLLLKGESILKVEVPFADGGPAL